MTRLCRAAPREPISQLRAAYRSRPVTAVAPVAERAPRGPYRAVSAVGVTVALWASAFVAIRYADRELSPGALALGRLLVGSLALGLLVLIRREPLPGRRQLPGIVVCGVLWFGVYNVALNAAETRIDAGTAAMLVNVGPILIAIFAGVILREGFPPRLFAGCLVSFAGAVIIGLATSRHGLHEILGAVLCVVAAFAYAGGVVAQKPVLRHASPLMVTWLACTIGAVELPPLRWNTRPSTRPCRRLDDRLDDLPGGGADRRSGSSPGPTRSREPPPGGWARQPISCRRWRCCSAGSSSARCRPAGPSGRRAVPGRRRASPAPAAGARRPLRPPRPTRGSTAPIRRKGGKSEPDP